MKYYLAYWKYKDWLDTRYDNPTAYHSSADIIEDITPGSELWLLTRKRNKQTIHVVQRIKVIPYSSAPVTKKKEFVVVGVGLANKKTIEATQKAIECDDKKDCWLEVLSRIATVRGKLLKSDTAGKFAERAQSPREITGESAALLAEVWKDRFG
jgi:hypothetical protein